MKLFLKDHFLLIILQIVQLSLLCIVFWLDGYKSLSTMAYALFLGFFLFSVYLIYQYLSKRPFYNKLTTPPQTVDESLEEIGKEPMSAALLHVLKSQYKLYQESVMDLKLRTDEHMTFIDRWVHQMKTPLSVIELTAQDLDEPVSSSLREETDRLKTGLHNVLYMARLRTITHDIQIGPVLLANLLQEVNYENKRFFIRNEVYPTKEIKNDKIIVETDKKWIRFIITQLIQNAVKYSTGKSNKICISIYERHGEAIFEVKDFGVGIPKKDHKRIFHAFYTGENGRHFEESTGMGLFLVKEVSNYLDHKIEMESIVGEGTTFRIVFSSAQNLTTM